MNPEGNTVFVTSVLGIGKKNYCNLTFFDFSVSNYLLELL